jgi:hypothetical protein
VIHGGRGTLNERTEEGLVGCESDRQDKTSKHLHVKYDQWTSETWKCQQTPLKYFGYPVPSDLNELAL